MDLIISLMEYAQSRYSLVLLMVFLLTFTKSCAVISLLIPGTSSVAHLRENLAAGALHLPGEAVRALDGIAAGAAHA